MGNVKLEARGVFFSSGNEEAYFTATFTLPRVGEVSARYTASRYVARVFTDSDNHYQWTDWRVLRQQSIEGVGEKTAPKVRELVEPVILEWLNSGAYSVERAKAVASYVIRTLEDSLTYGKIALAEYRSELTYFDHTRIAQAIDHLEAAHSLLHDKATV